MEQQGGKRGVSSMLFVRVLASYAICACSTSSSQTLQIDEMKRISSAD